MPEECGKGTGLKILPEGFAKSVQAEQMVGIVLCHLFKPQSVHCWIEGFLLICSMCGERQRLYLVAQPGDARAPAGSFTVYKEHPELLIHPLPSKRMKEEGLLLPPAVSTSSWRFLSEMAHRKGAGTPL